MSASRQHRLPPCACTRRVLTQRACCCQAAEPPLPLPSLPPRPAPARPARSLNQLLRLLAHHNLPLRLVRVLPRLIQASAAAAAAAADAEQAAGGGAAAAGARAGAGAAAPHHARAPSMPQTEAELALLHNDELAAAAASLALSRGDGDEDAARGYSSGGYASGGGGGYRSPERGGSGQSSPTRASRWLGRALPGSPSRQGTAASRMLVGVHRRVWPLSCALFLTRCCANRHTARCCRLARMRSAHPTPGGGSTASTSPERGFAGPAALAAGAAAHPLARVAGEQAGALPQVEAAQRLAQLLDGAINLLAGAAAVCMRCRPPARATVGAACSACVARLQRAAPGGRSTRRLPLCPCCPSNPPPIFLQR